MECLARWLYRYAGGILAAAVILFVVCGLYSTQLNGRLSGAGWTVPGSEEAQAEGAQDAGFVGRGSSSVMLLIRDERFSAPSAAFDRRVASVVERVSADPRLQTRGEVGWASLPSPQRREFLGADARTALTTLQLGLDDGTAKRVLPQVERELSAFEADGMRVYLVGQAAAFAATDEVGSASLARVELILLPLIVGILLWLYRSAVAALISLGVGVTAIVLATGALTCLAGVMDLTVIVQSIATMLGLGVSVDYSLIMIRRYIDESAASDRRTALFTTMRTAGRTVGASGTTVAAALATLFIVDLPQIHSIAVAGITGVAAAVVACLLVLPAVLHLLGPRVAGLRLPWLPSTRDRSRQRWDRLARTIMARPVAALTLTSAALLALAVPAFGLQTESGDASVLPRSSSVRQGYDLVEEQFGKGAVEPILVVLRSDGSFSSSADFARLAAMTAAVGQLEHTARVASPVPVLRSAAPADPLTAIEHQNFQRLSAGARTAVNRFVSADGKTIAIDVFSDGRAGDSGIRTLLDQVRAVARSNAAPGWQVSVGGLAAVLSSATQQLSDSSPVVVATMLVVMYVLLALTFRSLLLPCKAIVLNLLSVGAALGAVVLVFQHGFLADALRIASVGPIQNYVPILLVAVLFSLSTDYEVFLLSRVREHHDQTGDNVESVVHGVVETAPLISGAALLMATIFAAFVITPLVTVQQLGFAAAVAIAIDATIVRLVMVPAAMRLMGRWNWWLPTFVTPHRGRHRRGRVRAPGQAAEAGAQCVPQP
ncbi:membrane protein [Mycolicibacterium psychrotolerans]|uniref:Membrane protein n=3 Tax=Mycolicibacterium psychrotolerans TaxID=216929 RepID=A0A7I7MBK8_9MYCO|nr:membrane protein [Mycolicibacterium psychrotolerans]